MRDVLEIDGYRVTFEPGEGWRCECADFVEDQDCKHGQQAAAMRTLEQHARERGGSAARQ